jgi:cell wall-associated NlpC family hydrolase
MTETIPSSWPQTTIAKLFLFFLLFLLPCLSFKPIHRESSMRADDAEVMQFRGGITGYAQNFTGIRYRRAGRAPSTGFDCSGFTSYILDEFKVKVSACSRTQSTQGSKINLNDVLPGDLVFFGRRGAIQHVAMVVEKTPEGIMCVHSTSSRGVIVENISTSKYWKPKILFARDVIGDQVAE